MICLFSLFVLLNEIRFSLFEWFENGQATSAARRATLDPYRAACHDRWELYKASSDGGQRVRHPPRANLPQTIMSEKTAVAAAVGGTPSTSASPAKKDAITIKAEDMTPEMKEGTIELVLGAMQKFDMEKDMASYIKKDLDRKHGTTWHVIVGKNFGSFVTYGECLEL
jgi:dynein light chain LC8-type